MAARNSTGAKRAAWQEPSRHRVKRNKPELVAVAEPDAAPRQITFNIERVSIIAQLLKLESRLPHAHYDGA